MATFTPPTDNRVDWSAMDDDDWYDPNRRLQHHLFRHFQNGPRGRNVYKLVSGAYTESEPSDQTLIAVTYHGGHSHEVSSAEAAALTAAGYGAYVE